VTNLKTDQSRRETKWELSVTPYLHGPLSHYYCSSNVFQIFTFWLFRSWLLCRSLLKIH